MIRLCVLFFMCVCYIEFLSGTLGSKVLKSSNIPRFGEDDNTTDRCNDLLNEFATQSSKFSLCAVVHARPIHLCQRCVDQYKNVSHVYSLIHKANNSKGEKCGEVLLNSDRLGVIKQVNYNVQDLWNRGHCQSCFNLNETTGEYQLSSNTLNFIELHSATMACINNHPPKENSENSTVCGDCEKDYCALNEFYNKLKNLEDDAVCMDIVDTRKGCPRIINHPLAREDSDIRSKQDKCDKLVPERNFLSFPIILRLYNNVIWCDDAQVDAMMDLESNFRIPCILLKNTLSV